MQEATQERFLTSAEAARFLGLGQSVLPQWRYQGRGPTFRKHGHRVLYAVSDLMAWSASQARTSTAEAGEQRRPRRRALAHQSATPAA